MLRHGCGLAQFQPPKRPCSEAFLQPSVICGLFLFFGCAGVLYLKARVGPGPYTIGTVFGAVTLRSCQSLRSRALTCFVVTSLLTGALFPYPYYTVSHLKTLASLTSDQITETIIIPLALHSAISLLCSALLFPQSVNAQYIKRMAAALRPLEMAMRTQPKLLSGSPFDDEFDLEEFRAHLKTVESNIIPLAASARLIDRDLCYGRFSGHDLKDLHSLTRRLYVS